eukprot:6440659-Pyramimonas_sp.AAC.1
MLEKTEAQRKKLGTCSKANPCISPHCLYGLAKKQHQIQVVGSISLECRAGLGKGAGRRQSESGALGVSMSLGVPPPSSSLPP